MGCGKSKLDAVASGNTLKKPIVDDSKVALQDGSTENVKEVVDESDALVKNPEADLVAAENKNQQESAQNEKEEGALVKEDEEETKETLVKEEEITKETAEEEEITKEAAKENDTKETAEEEKSNEKGEEKDVKVDEQ